MLLLLLLLVLVLVVVVTIGAIDLACLGLPMRRNAWDSVHRLVQAVRSLGYHFVLLVPVVWFRSGVLIPVFSLDVSAGCFGRVFRSGVFSRVFSVGHDDEQGATEVGSLPGFLNAP